MLFKSCEGRDVFSLKVLPATEENKAKVLRSFYGFRQLEKGETGLGEFYSFQRKSFLPAVSTVIITSRNIFCLLTEAREDIESKHAFFTSSLQLVPSDGRKNQSLSLP